jgi:hypothetical protein
MLENRMLHLMEWRATLRTPFSTSCSKFASLSNAYANITSTAGTAIQSLSTRPVFPSDNCSSLASALNSLNVIPQRFICVERRGAWKKNKKRSPDEKEEGKFRGGR